MAKLDLSLLYCRVAIAVYSYSPVAAKSLAIDSYSRERLYTIAFVSLYISILKQLIRQITEWWNPTFFRFLRYGVGIIVYQW